MKKILPGIIFLVVVFAVVGAAVYFSKKTGDFERWDKGERASRSPACRQAGSERARC